MNPLDAAAALLERWLGPLADLAVRAVLFRVFFFAGLAKLDNWPGTLELFAYEYNVPLLPPEPAAVLAVVVELGCPLLLLAGLAARLAAVPLLGLAVTIQFVLGAANPAYDRVEHYLWMALLLSVIARGAGVVSLDRMIANRWGGGVTARARRSPEHV